MGEEGRRAFSMCEGVNLLEQKKLDDPSFGITINKGTDKVDDTAATSPSDKSGEGAGST